MKPSNETRNETLNKPEINFKNPKDTLKETLNITMKLPTKHLNETLNETYKNAPKKA